eukprot:g4732.t1
MKLPVNHVSGEGLVTPNAFNGIGQMLLEKMGWSQGEGLGKNRNGIRNPVKLKTQSHTQGLGHRPEPEWKVRQWTELYESSLQQIQVSFNRSPGTKTKKSNPVLEQEEVSIDRRNPDGTRTTASAQELGIYERLQSRRSGRWGLRRAKLERIKKQEEQNQLPKKHGLRKIDKRRR